VKSEQSNTRRYMPTSVKAYSPRMNTTPAPVLEVSFRRTKRSESRGSCSTTDHLHRLRTARPPVRAGDGSTPGSARRSVTAPLQTEARSLNQRCMRARIASVIRGGDLALWSRLGRSMADRRGRRLCTAATPSTTQEWLPRHRYRRLRRATHRRGRAPTLSSMLIQKRCSASAWLSRRQTTRRQDRGPDRSGT